MYKEIRDITLNQQVERLTTSLVQTFSINGTKGEGEIAEKIEGILRSYPYFQNHTDFVWTQQLPNDPLQRKNVFARVKGKGKSKKTVILHSHLDTVGVEDFGNLKDIANQPEKLLEFFKQWDHNKEIQQQALSGDWMFGRGALDMKSGIAVHLVNLLYFIEHHEEWDGEIIFMANPVEENQHTGVITAVNELLRLREEEGLQFIAAINNDFIYPLYPGDETKYIYTGAIGKLLPSFYVYGRETHVGQTLDGLDPTLVTSELNRLISNNMDLTEKIDGELMIPPSTLLQRDTKEFYNVQTAVTSFLYFNYMVYESSPKDIILQLKEIAAKAADNIKQYYEQQYKKYIDINRLPSTSPIWDLDVYTYEEFCEKLSKQGIEVDKVIEEILSNHSDMEPRLLGFKIIDTLRQLDLTVSPCIIIFYAPPYCPHNYLKNTLENQEVLTVIQEVTRNWEKDNEERFEIKRFFPFLSDSSYLSLHETDEEIKTLVNNFPAWDQIYPVPVKKIRKLNIPAINVGVYGLDAHRWTERVYKPYSFHTLPLLIRKMMKAWLK